MIVASLDEDAFRKPKVDKDASAAGILDIVEGFYSVEREDSDQDLFKAQVKDTPDIDGFHEVYADLLVGSPRAEKKEAESKAGSSKHGQSVKGKGKAPSVPVADTGLDYRPMKDRTTSHSTDQGQSRRKSLEGGRREERTHVRRDTASYMEDIIRLLDPTAEFAIIENHFAIPVLTEEERAKDEG